MIELLRSNDAVLVSFVSALLKEADIPFSLLDRNMSIMEGSLGVLPQRLMVGEDRIEEARRLLEEADIEFSTS